MCGVELPQLLNPDATCQDGDVIDVGVLDHCREGILGVPGLVVIHFRDGKLAHEHIYWDQASVLVQIGLLDPATLPIAGVETAKKAMDPSLAANALIRRAAAAK